MKELTRGEKYNYARSRYQLARLMKDWEEI